MLKSFNHSTLVTFANPKPHPATGPHQIMRFGRCRVRGVWMGANCGERAPMMKWVQRARACLCGRWVVVVVEYGDWISGGEHPQCCLEPTPPQHSIVSVQFSLIGTGGIHGWSSFGGAAGAGAAGGGGAWPEGSTEHYNQSMCVGLMINPLSLPSLGGLGSSLCIKAPPSCWCLPVNTLAPPPSVLFAPCGWEPVLAANITE